MTRAAIAILALAGMSAAAAGALSALERDDRMVVSVDGVPVRVAVGSSLESVVRRFDLDPTPGDLLDVAGGVLRPGAVPGTILVNGRAAPRRTRLREGDRIVVVDGRSRREPCERVVVTLASGIPASPQRSLARSRRVEVERGRLSGALDLRSAVPIGPFQVPRAVALTFDDGPSPHTRAILETLRRLRAPATFFVIGELAERRPKLVRRARAYGMAVGSHSYSHPYRPPFGARRRQEIRREIERGAAALRALGVSPTLFRPPGGTATEPVLDLARELGQRTVLWSVDAEDWRRGATAREIAARVLRDLRPGSIVLLHDGGGDRAQTLRALPAIVRGIRARGLELTLVDRP